MTIKTKLILGAVAAMVVMPVMALLMKSDDVGYAMDSGHDTRTAAELLDGKRPTSHHVTVTNAKADSEARVEYVLTQDGSEKGRWYFFALRTKDPKAKSPMLLVSAKKEIDFDAKKFDGVWTNGDTGINPKVVELFKDQGIRFTKDALVLDIDTSRDAKIQSLALTAGGAFGAPALALLCFIFMVKDDEKEEKRTGAAKQSLAGEIEQTRVAMRAAIRPYLQDPDATVQVRANCIGRKTPEIVLARDDHEQPAPPELAQILMGFHQTLKNKRVSYDFMSYTTFHIDDEGWRDKFEFS